MTATDIQVGDLIKATNKDNPEQTFTGRVYDVAADWFGAGAVGSRSFRFWDLEVLERPVPPVEDELLEAAIKAYRSAAEFPDPYPPIFSREEWGKNITAVINTVREFDSKKESSK